MRITARGFRARGLLLAMLMVVALLAGCADSRPAASSTKETPVATDVMAESSASEGQEESVQSSSAAADDAGNPDGEAGADAQDEAVAAVADVAIAEDYRAGFVHGDKPAECQKYIVLHDTEGESDAFGVIESWDATGAGVASHFVVNKDGSIVQCVPLDKIAHHAGFGDAGHNDLYGIVEDGRDDLVGTEPIGDWAPDYGMNAWSVGIELVHVGGSGPYPEEQLEALDGLIAYIDAYYGFESAIIDHKAWRSGNSDTSPEFAEYLANYQDHRRHV